MFVVEDRGVIFDATQQPAARRIAYFTSLCPLRSGVLLAGFQNGPSKHSPYSTIGICRSRDSGQSWEKVPFEFATHWQDIPGSLASAELVEYEPGRLLLFSTWFDRTDPDRPLFDPVTEGLLKSKQLLALSTDDGETWSDWHELMTPGLTGCAITGPAIRWADGTIAFAFESFKEYDDLQPAYHAAWVMITRDGGETFSPPMLVAQHPEHSVYYWDQRLCVGSEAGEFTALFWTHDRVGKRDLPVHFRRGLLDGGTLITEPILETPIRGQIAAPFRLPDGRLLAFVVDRDRPGTMTLWSSPDGGHSWPFDERHVVYTHDEQAAITQGRENIDFKQYWEDMGKWSFGHPAIQALPNGRVLLAWYAGTPDCMSLWWARVAVT